jgi:chromosome partitioning protein
MIKVICAVNQKSGVGKTTSTIILAMAFVKRGANVLVIDSDPQSTLSIAFGLGHAELDELHGTGKGYYNGLTREYPPFETVVIDGAPSIIPAGIHLANAEIEIASPFGTATVLKEKITELRKRYDVILIDCPPSLSLLTVNAIAASDAVFIPCKTDYFSVMGVPHLIGAVEQVRRHLNSQLEILGILPTMFDEQNEDDRRALFRLQSRSRPAYMFDPMAPLAELDRARLEGVSFIEFLSGESGDVEIAKFNEVVERIMNYEEIQKSPQKMRQRFRST